MVLCATIPIVFEGEKQLIQRDSRGLHRIVPVGLAGALFFAGSIAMAADIYHKDDDFVRLEKAEGIDSPVPSTLPALSADAVRAALSAVKLGGEGGATTPLLTDDQLDFIAAPIARGLRSASSGEDVVFAVHYRGSIMSYVGAPLSTAGRVWVEGDHLALILGQVQASYIRYALSVDPDVIHTGSRSAAQETKYHILPTGAVSLVKADRGDWARILPVAWVGTVGTPVAAAPASLPAPATVAAPVAPAAVLSASPPADPRQVEERFAALKRLLDNHLITQEDYDRTKDALLKAIAQPPGH
jgi:hypothetical protein